MNVFLLMKVNMCFRRKASGRNGGVASLETWARADIISIAYVLVVSAEDVGGQNRGYGGASNGGRQYRIACEEKRQQILDVLLASRGSVINTQANARAPSAA